MSASRRNILTAMALAPVMSAGAWRSPLMAQSTPLEVGVLIPGSAQDKGFMESASNGLKTAEAELGSKVKIQLIENINYADMEQAMTSLAQKNAFVAAVSGASQASMVKVSKRFPNVKFALVGGAKITEAENMSQYDIGQAQVNFLSGAAAALFSKSGSVGFLSGVELPGVVNASKEFINGAKLARPDIKTSAVFTGNFDDVSKAKEAALAMIAQGTDVHVHVLNRALPGLEQAAREKGTMIVGGTTNRCGQDPLYCAYSVTGVGYLLGQAIRSQLDGTWRPGSKAFGLKAGPQASDLIVCDASRPDIKTRIDEIKQDLVSGKITTLEG